MELDPIVLLAYVSVALNLITIVAAVAAYAVFWMRRQRKQRRPQVQSLAHLPQPAQALFLKAYVPPARPMEDLQASLHTSLQEPLGASQQA